MMRRRSWPTAAVLCCMIAFAGCDSGPKGPGTLLTTVSAGGALGAVTLEVVGPGVTGFEGVGGTHAYGGVVSARQNRHRVVLVDPVGGTLRVAIAVQDVRADAPTVTVVAAAGTDNLERTTTDVVVRVGGS
jgi:hypothetical protein